MVRRIPMPDWPTKALDGGTTPGASGPIVDHPVTASPGVSHSGAGAGTVVTPTHHSDNVNTADEYLSSRVGGYGVHP